MAGFLRKWLNEASDGAARRPIYERDNDAFWDRILDHPDPVGQLVGIKAADDPKAMLLGSVGDRLRLSASQTSVLCLGPPRSAGKTAGYLIPAVLMHKGPAVCVSTKPDMAIATSLVQARKGRCFQFSPDGSGTIPGLDQLRWSPTTGAQDWGKAIQIADAMVKASKPMGTGSVNEVSHHFDERASSLLAAICHYAAVKYEAGEKHFDMEFVVDIIANFDIKQELEPILLELQSWPESKRAARALRGILYLDNRERSAVSSTAAVVLKVYELPGALAQTKDPNFFPEKFVAGYPDMKTHLFMPDPGGILRNMGHTGADWPKQFGQYQTIYICSPAKTQELCGPLMVALLTAITGAGYDQAAQDAVNGKDRPPTLLAIDELGLISGFPALPNLLADGASGANMLLYCCMQDLKQASRWGTLGEAFPTLFGNIIGIRGIRDKQTLELMSMLVGDFDREVIGRSESRVPDPGWFGPKTEFMESQTWTRQAKLPPSAIYEGHPYNEDAALIFTPAGGWQWITSAMYFRTNPWPLMLLASASLAVTDWGIIGKGLPMPELAQGGNTEHLDRLGPQLARNYLELKRSYPERVAKVQRKNALDAATARGLDS